MLKAIRFLGLAKIGPLKLLKICVDVVQSRIELQVKKQKEARDKKTAENNKIA